MPKRAILVRFHGREPRYQNGTSVTCQPWHSAFTRISGRMSRPCGSSGWISSNTRRRYRRKPLEMSLYGTDRKNRYTPLSTRLANRRPNPISATAPRTYRDPITTSALSRCAHITCTKSAT